MQIKFKLKDLSGLEKIKNLEARSRNMAPAMRNIAGIMHDAVEEQFAQEGIQPKWHKLSPVTKKLRAKKGQWPGKILQASGSMATSIHQGNTNNTAFVATGMNVKAYAGIQNFGGMAGRGRKVRIPARKFMKVPQKWYDEIRSALRTYILRGNK